MGGSERGVGGGQEAGTKLALQSGGEGGKKMTSGNGSG